jgi:uncharacterized protein
MVFVVAAPYRGKPSSVTTREDFMQYMILAKDWKEGGLERRLAVRDAHLHLVNEMKALGNHLYAAATLDDQGQMNGSMMVVDFNSREELDAWLQREPYVTGNVWQEVQVISCRVGPSFLPSSAK